MPTVYSGREDIPELRGLVRGGLAVVAHTPVDLAGLQDLVRSTAGLPGDALHNLYHVVANAGSAFASWPGFAAPRQLAPGSSLVPDPRETGLHDRKAEALYAALGLAYDAWTKQGDDIDELACALLLPRPGRRVRFESRKPSLTLDYGSIRVRALAAGTKVREFGVSLFPVARSRRQIDLVEALRARAVGIRLPRLESLKPSDFNGKSGVIVFLHGLLSIDVGTFDQLVKLLQPQTNGPLLLVAWPHDTLDPIEVNAEELSERIGRKIGPTSLPVAFVCHSRGGLVARRTAVNLMKANRRWGDRLRACVTFGTPHEGAELAEYGDELLGRALLLRTITQQAGLVPLVDALWVVRQSRRLAGITDLRPRKNGGDFLRRLCKAEGRLAGEAGSIPMPVFAIGGNAPSGGVTGWLTRRLFRGTPNDHVVTLPSTMPEHLEPQAETSCDHFGYFTNEEIRKEHSATAIRFLRDALTAPARERQTAHRRDLVKPSRAGTRRLPSKTTGTRFPRAS